MRTVSARKVGEVGMTDIELKQCPFCGDHVQKVYEFAEKGISGIFCHGCKAMVKWRIEMEPAENYEENYRKWAEKWNRRAEG